MKEILTQDDLPEPINGVIYVGPNVEIKCSLDLGDSVLCFDDPPEDSERD